MRTRAGCSAIRRPAGSVRRDGPAGGDVLVQQPPAGRVGPGGGHAPADPAVQPVVDNRAADLRALGAERVRARITGLVGDRSGADGAKDVVRRTRHLAASSELGVGPTGAKAVGHRAVEETVHVRREVLEGHLVLAADDEVAAVPASATGELVRVGEVVGKRDHRGELVRPVTAHCGAPGGRAPLERLDPQVAVAEMLVGDRAAGEAADGDRDARVGLAAGDRRGRVGCRRHVGGGEDVTLPDHRGVRAQASVGSRAAAGGAAGRERHQDGGTQQRHTVARGSPPAPSRPGAREQSHLRPPDRVSWRGLPPYTSEAGRPAAAAQAQAEPEAASSRVRA